MSVKLNGLSVGNRCYPNGERMYDEIAKNISMNNNVANLFVQYQCSVDFENFIMLISYINTLPKVATKILNLWYVPYLRMDRQVDSKDPMIEGIRYILKTLCSGWHIRILDPHVDLLLPSNMDIEYISIQPFINYIVNKEKIDLICFPDIGAQKRYAHYFKGNMSNTFANKKRDVETGKIMNISIDPNIDYKDRSVLIVDDICSYGGTSNAVAQQLKESEAQKVIAWYSHTEISIYHGRIFTDKYIDKVYTSNSIMSCGENITFLSSDNNNVFEI